MKVKNRIKIIIADDHAFFRKGLASVIHDNENYELIGEAADGEELFQLLNCKIPDIILMDVQMPGMDGMEITRNIIKKFPLIRIIALTAFDEDYVIRNMMKAGAYSFLDNRCQRILFSRQDPEKGFSAYGRPTQVWIGNAEKRFFRSGDRYHSAYLSGSLIERNRREPWYQSTYR
jgi:CheY-like chemotaxis protein